MSGNLVESLIGAIVLAVAGWFLSFAYEHTEKTNVGGYELIAKFDRVDGLNIGSDVRLAGIKIGTVTSQELDPETYEAIVRVAISDEVALPTDTAAVITSEGLLGGNYLSMLPGGMEDMLADGDELEETQDAIDLVGMINRFMYGKKDEDEAKE